MRSNKSRNFSFKPYAEYRFSSFFRQKSARHQEKYANIQPKWQVKAKKKNKQGVKNQIKIKKDIPQQKEAPIFIRITLRK